MVQTAAMRLANLLGPDLQSALETDPSAVRDMLEEFHPEDIAEIVGELPPEQAASLMRLMPNDMAAEMLSRLSAERQVEVFEKLGVEEGTPVLSEMWADDRVDLVQELPEELKTSVLDKLDEFHPEAAEETRELEAYGEETAGGLMTPEFVALAPDTKVWQAIEEVRRLSRENEVETIYYIYVVAFGKLVGVLSLRDLILADPGNELGDIMRENVVRVRTKDDQEIVAEMIAKYDLNAVPVVSEHGQLLGVVTVDDVVDVVIEEATEDAQMMGGVVPLEDSYFQTDFVTFVKKRLTWLVVLFFGQLLTATVMEEAEHTLQIVSGLIIFIPLIIATGGNSGSQSSSLIIRALAVGELEPKAWFRVFRRELAMGITLGLLLGAIGFGRAVFAGDGGFSVPLALSVSISIVCVVTIGTLMGSLLPMGMERLGLDPAVSSTPFIASLVDVLGLMVYFGVAQFIFSWTHP